MLEVFSQVLTLGIVEGLTEFLPVSSTGHLILVGELLRFQGHFVESFDIFIQLGAILAVIFLYRERFIGLVNFSKGGNAKGSFEGISGLVKLGVACLPAFVAGLLFYGYIKRELFSPFTVALALIVGGIVMILVELFQQKVRVKTIDDISLGQAFLVGLAQCLALWPGMSRSACTIVGGMFCGMDRKTAAEFSFLAAVPLMIVAVLYDLYKSFSSITTDVLWLYGLGFVVSFITAILEVRLFLDLLNRTNLIPFALYRIALGIIVVLLIS
ncbi:MAG: undecaprenyl-diphosphate phosphatase [SAR324 cluster bacterium]|uniref:Undecaprenyl-diphosphatase n=1 Tax=SAR324 cluster bacterium TaxID=2024889 RepID=A0A7X9FRM0_9DELT|nr:undecaprenyl-diphosphate phosphatase [SAR324 cluster bacterium]